MSRTFPLGVLVAGALAIAGCSDSDSPSNEKPSAAAAIAASEDVILLLSPKLKDFGTSLRNLVLPDEIGRSLFADQVRVRDIGPSLGDEVSSFPDLKIRSSSWPVADEAQAIANADLSIWSPLVSDFQIVEHGKVYIIRGEFEPGSSDRFVTDLGAQVLGQRSDGSWRAARAKLKATWRASGDLGGGAEPTWRIVDFQTKEMIVTDAERRLFADVLTQVVPDRATRRKVRRSVHQERLVQFFRDGNTGLPKRSYFESFAPDALGQHPACSVVDIDNDGWDDIYVMARWGKNVLLRNQGDGTFEDVAPALGLAISGLCTGAVFADYDNDGDKDVFVTRSLERTQYYRNEGGTFVDASASHVLAKLPFLASSASTADYDGDGLLDVYISTYALPYRELKSPTFSSRFLGKEDVLELFARAKDAYADNALAAMVGPPNLLLHNVGDGRFEVSAEDAKLDHWYATFQATWSDFDGDHDPDLYLANDYSPDRLYRNDAGSFTEVSEQVAGGALRGFGMGATFGDYDQDGRQDLYVSNMFSKAGMRITDQVEGVDQRLRASAEGNLLLRNEIAADGSGRLVVRSGLESSSLQVAKAGWSWGGQFTDFDCDGWLDIYVSSGFYTAPPEIATDVDL